MWSQFGNRSQWSWGLVLILYFISGLPDIGAIAPKGHPKETKTKSVEKSLVRMILNRYEQFGVIGRPVNDSKIQVVVSYGLQLFQILDLDENKQILRTNCWSMYTWRDPLLRWNGTEYGDIRTVRIFPSQIWTPDIKLYNFADERLIEHREARVVIYMDGSTLWVPQALFKSTCEVEITYFPFDTQICMLEFGSWTYDETQMDIVWWRPDGEETPQMPYLDFSDYVPSNEWRTDGEKERSEHHTNRTIQIRSVKKYRYRNQTVGDEIISRKYPVLRYLIRLRRNPSFYVFMLVIPCVLLSSLTLVVFWLPPESPAKMMLGMNIFVAFFVLLLLLAESTPSAVKNFPLIGVYFCLNMIMITLSTFLATLVIHLYFRGDRNGSVPCFLRRFVIEGVGRLILVRQRIPLPDAVAKTSTARTSPRTAAGGAGNPSRQFPQNPFGGGGSKFLMNDALQYHQQQQQQHHPEVATPYGPPGWNPGALSNSVGYPMFDARVGHNPAGGPAPPPPHAGRSKQGAYFYPYGYPDPSASVPFMNAYDPSMRMSAPNTNPYAKHQPTDTNVLSDDADPAPNAPNGIPTVSPDLLNTTATLERDVREVKRYVKLFVNRQKEMHRRSLIAMEWRTLALVLDRLFFFLYITTIGIAVIISVPRTTEPELPEAFRDI